MLWAIYEKNPWAKGTPIPKSVFNFKAKFSILIQFEGHFFHAKKKNVPIFSSSQIHPDVEMKQFSAAEKSYKLYCSTQYFCLYYKDPGLLPSV